MPYMKRQRGIPGTVRKRIGATVRKDIRRAARAEAREYGVSVSWVLAVRLADSFGIPLDREDRYRAMDATIRHALRIVQGGRGRHGR